MSPNSLIDASTEFGQRALQRLDDESVVWLTTVSNDGTPLPRPVWFYWDGTSVLFFSQPNRPKLRHIARNPGVALNFNSDAEGDDVLVLLGEARVVELSQVAQQWDAYAAKYADAFPEIDMTRESFIASFSVPVLFVPRQVQGH